MWTDEAATWFSSIQPVSHFVRNSTRRVKVAAALPAVANIRYMPKCITDPTRNVD